MPQPRMVVVAGPPGSGKTTAFPLATFGAECFNADDRAADLNGGSYKKIPKEIRAKVNVEFQRWILEHIAVHKSFALETTLRTTITFEQARLAREHEFRTTMYYVSAGSVEESTKRVMERAYRGGHSASEQLIRGIYGNSMRNILAGLNFPESGIEVVRIYDNSQYKPVRKLMTVQHGCVTSTAPDIPLWLRCLLKGTKFDI